MDELSEAVDVLTLPAPYEELPSSSPSPVVWYCASWGEGVSETGRSCAVVRAAGEGGRARN